MSVARDPSREANGDRLHERLTAGDIAGPEAAAVGPASARRASKRRIRCLPIVGVFFSALAACTTAPAPDSISVYTLNAALEEGTVRVEAVRGNGTSSGMALLGTLRNTTNRRQMLGARLSPPLFLRSRNDAVQDMLATAVFEAGGRYFVLGDEPVLELPPLGRLDVVFNAYCVDFEKENPSETDGFRLAPLPPSLIDIGNRIIEYERESDSAGIDTAVIVRRAQTALWIAQGESSFAIRDVFGVSRADIRAARELAIWGF